MFKTIIFHIIIKSFKKPVMPKLNELFIDKIVQNCFNLYNKLPKTGKPIDNEWTVLSCFIKYDKSNKEIEIVSLGTGSKCIGATKMSSKGDILNDSHAEIFARRGFLIYLYENITRTFKGETSIFNTVNEEIKLNDNVEFIFYSSQLPCGDASIIPKNGEFEQYGDILNPQKRPAHIASSTDITGNKKQKLINDVYRTGAKCLPNCEQDSKESGLNYHLLGQVRTKPGRGDRTLSVSCSDKIAKWIYLGVQGSLLDILCGPIYVKYFIFGAGVPYCEKSLNRAFLNRNSHCVLSIVPEFYQTSLVFANIKTNDKTHPAPGSIVWVKSSTPLIEVAVQGRRLGVTKKKAVLPSNSLCISKYNLYRKFLNIINMHPAKKKLCNVDNIEAMPYNVMKSKSKRYIEQWLAMKCNFFKTWTVKPDLWNFCIKDL